MASGSAQMTQNSGTLRVTQRAPKSCVSCKARKVRCDRNIPCQHCVRRGEAGDCAREAVLIRGKVVIAQEGQSRSYNDLLEENSRLRREMECLIVQRDLIDDSTSEVGVADIDQDYFEDQLWASDHESFPSIKSMWPNIILPSQSSSMKLVEFDRVWNSWVHAALDHPAFEKEHSEFLSNLENGASIEEIDPLWLALYFNIIAAALLLSDDEEAKLFGLPSKNHQILIRTWYSSSLYCLEAAQFMRSENVRVVQTIAVLNICFNNFGDFNLASTMLSCAIRIGQKLNMHKDSADVPGLQQKYCRRLWWTLMICEWMAPPSYIPCISKSDCFVPLPAVDLTDDLNVAHPEVADPISPIQYHKVMAQIATTIHRFKKNLRSGRQDAQQVVLEADAELADLIDTMPAHLQPDAQRDLSLEEVYPWITWQRWDLSLVFLSSRLNINRTLQKHWLSSPEILSGPRSICLSSAKGIVHVTQQSILPIAKRRQWALSFHVVAAAIFLITETRTAVLDNDIDYEEKITACVKYLEAIKSWNAVASKGSKIIQELLGGQIHL